MAYDEDLARRVWEQMKGTPGFTEKKMFGGVCYLLNGNMAGGVHGDDLIVRLGVEQYDEALKKPFARPFDMTGRPMKGWVMVAGEGVRAEAELASWVQQGIAFARSLPAK